MPVFNSLGRSTYLECTLCLTMMRLDNEKETKTSDVSRSRGFMDVSPPIGVVYYEINQGPVKSSIFLGVMQQLLEVAKMNCNFHSESSKTRSKARSIGSLPLTTMREFIKQSSLAKSAKMRTMQIISRSSSCPILAVFEHRGGSQS